MNLMQSSVMSGLTSDSCAVDSTGTYSLKAFTTCLVGSGLVVTITQSGSQSLSFSTPAGDAAEGSVAIQRKFSCAQGDILSVSLASSAAIDQPPSVIRTVVSVYKAI